MRQFITIVENAQEGLSAVSLDDLMRAFRSGYRDIQLLYHNSRAAYGDMDEFYAANFNEMKRKLEPYSHGVLTLYRGLTVEPDTLQGLGRHWTLDIEATEHFGRYVVEASVDQDAVDWPSTLARAFGMWDDEHEISLIPGSHTRVAMVFDKETGHILLKNRPGSV